MESRQTHPLNVHYELTDDEDTANKTSSVVGVEHDIDSILKEITELNDRIPKDDPAYKENLKKLNNVKKQLHEKSSSGLNLLSKLHLRKKTSRTNLSEAEAHDDVQPTKKSGASRLREQTPDIINISISIISIRHYQHESR